LLVEISKIKGLPVGVMSESRKGGETSGVVFDHAQGKVIGFTVKGAGMFSAERVISLSDVVSVDQQGVVVRSSDDIIEKAEIVRIDQILRKKTKLIGMRVYGTNKRFLGYVYDAVIESQGGDLVRIYVRFLWRKFIFSREQITAINERRIVVDTDAKILNTEMLKTAEATAKVAEAG